MLNNFVESQTVPKKSSMAIQILSSIISHPLQAFKILVQLFGSLLIIIRCFGLPHYSPGITLVQSWKEQAHQVVTLVQNHQLHGHDAILPAQVAALAAVGCPAQKLIGISVCSLNPLSDETYDMLGAFLLSDDEELVALFNQYKNQYEQLE